MNQPLFGKNQQSPYVQQLLAQQLQQQNKPIHNPVQGVAEVGKQLANALMARKGMEAQAAQKQDRAKAFSDALMPQEAQMPAGQFGPGAPEQPSPQMIAQRLLGNPDTAQFGAQMMMGNIQNQQERENELSLLEAKMPHEMELARQKAQINNQYQKPTTDYRNYERAQNDPEFARYLNEQKSAAVLLANEMAAARGDDRPTQDDLRQAAKIVKFDAGVTPQDSDTEVAPVSGYTEAVSEIEGSKEFAKKVSGNAGEQLMDKKEKAGDAKKMLFANQQAREVLDSGVITGFGAEFATGLGKALSQAGLKFADDPIANTEAYVAMRASAVGDIIKQFGAGTGLSDADRAYAEKAAAGKIAMNEQSIRKILDISDRAAQRAIDVYNQELEKVPESAKPYDISVDQRETNPKTKGGEESPEDDPLGIMQ